MKDRLEQRLQRLNMGRPDPALRARLLGAAEIALGERRASWSWWVEALLAGGVAAACAFLLVLNGDYGFWSAPRIRIDEPAVRALVEELELNPGMERDYRGKLAWMEKRLAATRRYDDEERGIEYRAY